VAGGGHAALELQRGRRGLWLRFGAIICCTQARWTGGLERGAHALLAEGGQPIHRGRCGRGRRCGSCCRAPPFTGIREGFQIGCEHVLERLLHLGSLDFCGENIACLGASSRNGRQHPQGFFADDRLDLQSDEHGVRPLLVVIHSQPLFWKRRGFVLGLGSINDFAHVLCAPSLCCALCQCNHGRRARRRGKDAKYTPCPG
jgi:hypothetical protein